MDDSWANLHAKPCPNRPGYSLVTPLERWICRRRYYGQRTTDHVALVGPLALGQKRQTANADQILQPDLQRGEQQYDNVHLILQTAPDAQAKTP